MYSVAGVPDLLVIHSAWRGFIETKVKGNTPSGKQLDFANLCTDRSFPVVFITFEPDGHYTCKGYSIRKEEWVDFESNKKGLLHQLSKL